MYSKELPGLPPKREGKFSINQVPRVGQVLMAPYIMAPVELKKQVEELFEKQFIKPNVSPWGAPVLLLKNKDGGLGYV